MTNSVLAGALPSATFEATLLELLPLEADGRAFVQVQPILASLDDVELNDTCSARSVGLARAVTPVAPR
ncbi:MAG: hypothetical protein R3B40_23010 [Polyangiales bacterium]